MASNECYIHASFIRNICEMQSNNWRVKYPNKTFTTENFLIQDCFLAMLYSSIFMHEYKQNQITYFSEFNGFFTLSSFHIRRKEYSFETFTFILSTWAAISAKQLSKIQHAEKVRYFFHSFKLSFHHVLANNTMNSNVISVTRIEFSIFLVSSRTS